MAVARDKGLEHFFGIPGGGSPLELIEAGRQCRVAFVNMSHESSAAIAAAAYGKVRNTAGLAMSIRGVGAANLAGGVANASFERLPLVGICEAPPVSSQPTESVQQCHQQQLFSGVARYQRTLDKEHALQMIQDAFAQAVLDRPIPSVLHLPAGLGEVDDCPSKSFSAASNSPSPDNAKLRDLKEFITKHPRLAVLAGADVVRSSAAPELKALIESLGAVVLVTMDARGVFPESHSRWAGVFLGLFNPNVIESRVFQKVDGVILVGVDAMMTHAPWRLDIHTSEIAASPEYSSMTNPAARVNGDLKVILKALVDEPRPGVPEAEVCTLREGILQYFKRPSGARLAAQDVIEITRELLPADGLLLSETGAFVCMLEHLWPVEKPGTFLGTSGGRTMGLMIPAALGAALADHKRAMVGLGADGSLLMRLGELEVFARAAIAVPLVIINDQALGTMKARQKSRGFPDYGLDFHSVDFAAIARAFGLQGVTVETPEAFRRALAEAMKSKSTTLIEARVDREAYQNSFSPTIGDLGQLSKV
jgi:acetolactate synthase-1/2/3 large subunit